MVSNPVVRLDGLPYRVTKEELADFFTTDVLLDGLNSIFLISNRGGRASGFGFLELSSENNLEIALSKNKKNIGRHNRYAAVTESSRSELDWHLNRSKIRNDDLFFRVKLISVPFRATEYDIVKWFGSESGCEDVETHLNTEGRSSGIVTAFFRNQNQAESALEKDHEEMNGRYIELRSLFSDGSLPRRGCIVRMNGLPFRATSEEMVEFFAPNVKCIGVNVIFNGDNRSSGDALAEFKSEDDVDEALKKDRQRMGSRFIRLSRYHDSSNYEDDTHMVNSGESESSADKFVLRMGGLPYDTSEEDIVDWFRPKAACMRAKILNNRDGRPSGEALAEFDSYDVAENARTSMNRKYIGKRFIVLTALY